MEKEGALNIAKARLRQRASKRRRNAEETTCTLLCTRRIRIPWK
jgi:hypothetical protein